MAIARARAINDRPVVIDFIVAAALTTPNPSSLPLSGATT